MHSSSKNKRLDYSLTSAFNLPWKFSTMRAGMTEWLRVPTANAVDQIQVLAPTPAVHCL